jgi:hypothetical protein
MSINAWLLTGLLIGAPPSAPEDVAPAPRLEKGLEITWQGTLTEAVLRPNVHGFHSFEVETRLFVLDVCDGGSDAALMTSIKQKPDLKGLAEPLPVCRLELVRVEPNGKMSLLPPESLTLVPEKRKPLPLPLMAMEALPTFEPSVFLAFPQGKLRLGQSWSVPEEKRPPVNYRLEGFDSVRGSRCFKVGAVQQTDDWKNSQAGSAGWRRNETILVSIKHGHASRIERTIEKRDPQSGELGYRSKLTYELAGYMRYPDRFGEDRRDEIMGAVQFTADFERAVNDLARTDGKPFEALLKQIDYYLSNHFADSAPYRQAILYVKRKAERAKRGYIAPAAPAPETTAPPALAVGKPLPDANTIDLANQEPVALGKLRGRPALLIYYQPASARTAEPVLRFAQSLFGRDGAKALILPVAIGDPSQASQQRLDWKLSIHVLAGRPVYKQHGIDSTPCFVVMDAEGIVRSIRLGWSQDTAEVVRADLERWVK